MERKCVDCKQVVQLANANGFPAGWVNPEPVEVVCQDDLYKRNLGVALLRQAAPVRRDNAKSK